MAPRRPAIPLVAAAVLACAAVRVPAEPVSCTGPAGCRACVPECVATWDDHKTKEPCYSMTREPAGARVRDPWHAPRPECRCQPPAGRPYVKKKLFKTDGPERRERVPKYDVHLVPGPVCAVEAEHRPWWHGLLGALLPWSCR